MTPVRAAALLAMLGAAVAIAGLAGSPAFAYRTLRIEGPEAMLTDRAVVEEAVALVAAGTNVFRVEAGRIEERLASFPAVASAEVAIELPDTIRVRLVERTPVLAWVAGGTRAAVDATGRVVAIFPAEAPGPSAGLVAILDRRAALGDLSVGTRIDPLLVDAATRLGSLTTGDVGSREERLVVALDDVEGFTVRLAPDGPVAVFGFYTASLRSPGLIPGQVRLLRSLLAGRERKIGRVILASDTNGTWLPKGATIPPLPTPTPSPSPAPGATDGTTGATP